MKCPEPLLGSGLNCIFMKKLIILDFDGTIADTRPVILNTFHRTLDAMDMPQHSDEEIAATIGLPLLKAFPVLEPMDE